MWLDSLILIGGKILNPIIEYITGSVKQNLEINVHQGDKIALKAISNGHYVQANKETPKGELIAKGSYVDTWENFEIVDIKSPFSYVKNKPVRYGDKIGL